MERQTIRWKHTKLRWYLTIWARQNVLYSPISGKQKDIFLRSLKFDERCLSYSYENSSGLSSIVERSSNVLLHKACFFTLSSTAFSQKKKFRSWAVRNSFRWQIYITNSVDGNKLSCYTFPLTQHQSFFRNVPLLPKKLHEIFNLK